MKEKEDPKIDNVVDVDVPTASKFVTGVQPETLFEAAEKEADEEEKKKEEEEKVEIAKEVESKEDFSVTATKTQKAVRVVVEDDDDEDEKEEEQKAAAAEAAAVMAVTTTPPPKTEEEKMEEEDAPITQLKDENGAGGGGGGKEELTVPDAADLPVPLPPTPFAGTSSPAVSTKRPSPMSHKEGDKVLSSSDDAAATAEPKEEEEGSPNKKAKTNFADAGPTIVVPEEA